MLKDTVQFHVCQRSEVSAMRIKTVLSFMLY